MKTWNLDNDTMTGATLAEAAAFDAQRADKPCPCTSAVAAVVPVRGDLSDDEVSAVWRDCVRLQFELAALRDSAEAMVEAYQTGRHVDEAVRALARGMVFANAELARLNPLPTEDGP